MIMTVVGFIPGLDVISDAYFLGRAILDVVQGRGSWADVAMNAAFLLAPAVGGAYFRAAKTALNVAEGLGDAGKVARRGSNVAEAAQDLRNGDKVAGGAKLADDVVRGGKNLPEDFERSLKKGISGRSAPGKSDLDLLKGAPGSKPVPHNQYGSTTVGQIRAQGGDVIATPSTRPYDPWHVTIVPGPGGVDPLSALFRPTKHNPFA